MFQVNLHYLLLTYNFFHFFDHAQKLHVFKSIIKIKGMQWNSIEFHFFLARSFNLKMFLIPLGVGFETTTFRFFSKHCCMIILVSFLRSRSLSSRSIGSQISISWVRFNENNVLIAFTPYVSIWKSRLKLWNRPIFSQPLQIIVFLLLSCVHA